MVDLEVLQLYGIDEDGLREKFDKPREKRSDKVNALVDRIKNRCQAGRDLNIENYQIFYAMDLAWDQAFRQITPTLLTTLTDKTLSEQELLNSLKQFGMDPSEVFIEKQDPKTPGENTVKVSAAAFIRVVVPLVVAYIKIRWAKLCNDRKTNPQFTFTPVVNDAIARMKCSVITSRVDQIARQYGYYDLLKQIIFRMLLYGECLQFPVEHWHTQCQEVAEDSPYQGEIKTVKGAKVKKVVVREGIRYHLPHPTRTYRDQAFFPSTLNTDTGGTFAGYVRILKWSDIEKNESFYNKSRVGCDNFHKWYSTHCGNNYWKHVWGGCALNFPGSVDSSKAVSRYDSEAHLEKWYSSDMSDRPVLINEHWEKLIPKDHGLGDYEHEVWFRFVIAADDQVIYACPVAYPPVTWYGYDYPEGRTHNVSMALEVLPFQDQFSNLLSQLLLTTRQNLANVTFINTDVLDESVLAKIKNWGEKWWRSVVNLVPVSFRRVQTKGMSELREAVISHKFPMGNTAEIMQSMRVILDTLERVLVMSAQEVGQSASHEQTRKEIEHIAANTSTRVVFTGTAIDSGRDAWKRQLYMGLMAYGEEKFYAMVPMEEPFDENTLAKLGFTAGATYDEKKRRQYLRVENKTAVAYESFASDKDVDENQSEVQVAQQMILLLDKAMNNPITGAAIGPDQALAWINQIGKYLGLPRDFQLHNTGQTQSMMDQVQGGMAQLKEYIDQAMGDMTEDLHGALGEITKKNKQQDATLEGISAKLSQILGEASEIETPRRPVPSDSDIVPANPESVAMALNGIG